jgi:NADH:ubiquinone reductase (H+-translocating)
VSPNRQVTQDAPHVVVIGAGFAGQSVVDSLAKGSANVRVTVIDHNLYSTFQPLLYQVATGGLNPGDVSYAVGGFAGRRRARYIQGELAAVDAAQKRITLADGRELGYDYLVLAIGVTASFFGIPGAEQNAFALYTRRDSVVLRDHIMAGFERLSASDSGGDEEFAVTVVGGGATGVELAGTLAELRGAVLKATFPDVDPSRVHIRLVEMAPQLLMPFHPKLRQYTFDQLARRGVDIRLNTRIREVQPGKVLLDDGQTVHSDLTVWAAGVAAPKSVRHWGFAQGKNGRITVGGDLRVTGQDAIFAVGDIGINPDDPSPQLAQPALQQGHHAGAQIKRLIAGEDTRPFSYHDKGTMATIGRRSAVVQLAGGLRMTGTIAWLAWLALHLVYLLGFRNRVSTLINLSWRYIAWGHGGGVIVGDPPQEPVPQAGSQTSVADTHAPSSSVAE